MQTGWLQLGDIYYYLNADGTKYTGWLLDKNQKYYYLDVDGVMVTGWFQDTNGKWYYLGQYGDMKTGWLQYAGKWYYLGQYGDMKTGWIHLGDNWFYCSSDGVMQTGWLTLGSKTYYLKDSGVMVTGTYKIGDIPYSFNSDGVLDKGQSVVNYAMQFIGNPYVWGGTSLTNGCDCSGFTMRIFEKFGVTLTHNSTAQRSKGQEISSLAAARPGDLLCYEDHVGIYIGNGQMVNASNSNPYPVGGIKTSSATYKTIITIRRLV